MSSIDISKLRNRWMGKWNPSVRYETNDVVQYRGSSYVCIKDIPESQVIVSDTGVSTNFHMGVPSTLVLESIEPTNGEYWLDMAPAMAWRKTWTPRSTYTTGDVVELGGDLYVCIRGGVRNTYVLDANYWTKIFENADRDHRYICTDFYNQQPLGWTRNNGDAWWGSGTPSWVFGFIGYDGNAYAGGARYRGAGMGNGSQNSAGQTGWATPAFSFVDWLISTDNGGSGRFTTPDGQPPKVVQWVHNGGDTTAASGGMSLWVLNNGELYASGYNAHGQLGLSDTTQRWWPTRVNSTVTTDWLGNTVRSFNNTRIIKACTTSQGHWNQGATSCYALGDDGTVWSWGYNAYGQLGLGPVAGSTNSVGQAETNQTQPRRMPQSFFDHKKIVDIMAHGGNNGWVFAVDEDGQLWTWGISTRGGNGLSDRHADTGYTQGRQFTPVKVSIDWPRYGGIKKIMMNGQNGDWEHTFILDGEGYLWFAGWYQQNNTTQMYGVSNSGTTTQGTTKFVRLDKNWFGDHKIENFWLCGGGEFNVILREKGTGLTYAFGTNEEGQLGTAINHRYSGSSWSPFPNAIRGVRYVKDAIILDSGKTSSTTIMMLTDDGEIWTRGTNSLGAMGVGYAGSSLAGVEEIADNGSQNEYIRTPLPPGAIANAIADFGPEGNDAVMVNVDNGGVMIAGWDGSSGGAMIQGHLNVASYNNRISGISSYHWYSLHSYPG
jgi:alpha-tubulin suppressor-like RCC1 family protein